MVWSAPDGRETAVAPDAVQIQVADGLRMEVAFDLDPPDHVSVNLTLKGRSPRRDGCGEGASRFVVVPLDDASSLVGVADASDSPATLCPTLAHPAWVASGSRLGSTREEFVEARGPKGGGLRMSFDLGPGESEDTCILRISCAGGGRSGNSVEGASPRLSVARLAPATLRIVAGPLGA
ncbi:MAG TPA: hypothetical protein VKF62_11015 [Planctomycetota bacterium]|nr:hypothetical protein [Planctomycetota bacterium]